MNTTTKPAVQALLFLQSQKPQNLLDYVALIMIALEDCNYHSELAQLQEITGIKVNQFYSTQWDTAGVQLARMLTWCGEACCLTVMASCPELQDKKGLAALMAAIGINVSNYKL